MTVVGYDLESLARLDRAGRAAVDALAHLRSLDPAAEETIDAVRRLVRFLSDVLLPAVDEVRRRDPLAALRREWTATSDHLHRGDARSGRDLLDTLADLEIVLDGAGAPATEATVAAIAPALARHAHRDPELASALVELSAAGSPWPAIATGHAVFDPDLVDRIASALLRRTSWSDDALSRQQAVAAGVVLGQIATDDRRSLRLLGDVEVAAELATWPLVDRDLADRIADRALTAVTRRPDLLGDVQHVVTGYVSLANTDRFERGFPSPLAGDLAAGIVRLLPTFVARIHDPVDWAGADGFATGSTLGGYEELVDFLGALLRDPRAADTLLAGVADAARLTLDDGAWHTLDDVGDFALALERAAINERLEEEMAAAAHRVAADHLTSGLAATAAAIGATTVAGPAARAVASAAAEAGRSVVRRTFRPTDAGTPPAGEMAAVLITHTVLTELVADHRLGVGADPELVAAARDAVARADASLAAHDPDVRAIRRAHDDAVAAIVRLGGAELLADLDVGSLGRLADRDPDAD